MGTSRLCGKIRSTIFYIALFGIILFLGIRLFDTLILNEGASVYANSDESGHRSPGMVDAVEEDFWGDGELHVRVKNVDVIGAYVRILPEFSARDKNGDLCDLIVNDEDHFIVNSEYWIKIGAYYYYKFKLAPGKYTQFFIESFDPADGRGNSVEVKFTVDALDCSDPLSVQEQWKINVNAFGEITG